MKLTVGDKVVYPCQGPCLISSVVEKVIADQPRSFFHLVILDDHAGELFVPVERVKAMGMRPLLEKSEIPQLLDRLMTTTEIVRDWKQRANDNLKLFTSGSAIDLAKIIGSLTELSETKMLSLRESWTLARAKKFLVCEISEVTGKSKTEAEEQVDQVLKARKIAGVSGKQKYQPISELSL